MLGVFNCILRVTDAFELMRVHCGVKPKLNFVKTTCEAKERHVCSLDHAHILQLSAVGALQVKSCNGYERFKSFEEVESF